MSRGLGDVYKRQGYHWGYRGGEFERIVPYIMVGAKKSEFVTMVKSQGGHL